ncbi:MAG TPA: protein BatD [Candidatus Marinimicrobia bacterium]|nr:protein BatD [Candidatus Neomarinimicrobiota bacterium]
MRKVPIIVGLILWVFNYGFGGISVKAYCDRTEIFEDEVFTFTIELEGAMVFPDIKLPSSQDFVVISGPSQSSQIQIINGKMSSFKSVSWRLAPTKTGKITIGPVEFKIKNRKYRTQPVVVTVRARASVPSGKPQAKKKQVYTGNEVFLKAIPNKTSVYVGEEVDVVYYLYYNRVRTFSRDKLPDAKGFWMESFPVKDVPDVETEIINGRRYKKAEVQRIAFFPTVDGELVIDPMVLSCEVVIPRRRTGSLFDDFFNDPFFDNPFFEKTKVVTVTSDSVRIKVLPIPGKNKPESFSGAVGRGFRIGATIDTTVVKQNQAISLRYVVSGEGNVNFIKLPEPDLPEYFEIFKPKIDRRVNNRGSSISGEVVYEYVIIPRVAGEYTIPPMRFAYFDPVRKRFVEKSSRSFKLRVLPVSEVASDVYSGFSKDEISLLSEDIRFIDTEIGELRKIGDVFYKKVWFWLMVALAIFNVAASYGIRYYRVNYVFNEEYMRKKDAYLRSAERIRKASKAIEEGKPEDFATLLYQALAGFVSDRLLLENRIPGVDTVRENLQGKVPDEFVSAVVNVLDRINMVRFSPGSAERKECAELAGEVKRILDKLAKEV